MGRARAVSSFPQLLGRLVTLRVGLLVALLLAIVTLAISAQQGYVYLFIGSLGVILTVIVVSVALTIINHE